LHGWIKGCNYSIITNILILNVKYYILLVKSKTTIICNKSYYINNDQLKAYLYMFHVDSCVLQLFEKLPTITIRWLDPTILKVKSSGKHRETTTI